jgi:hypothetical protein
MRASLVDEEEVYRLIGGCLPVEFAQPSVLSLKHKGNFVDKGRGNAINRKYMTK